MNSNTSQKVAIGGVAAVVALALGVGAYNFGKQTAAGTQPQDTTPVASSAPFPQATTASVAAPSSLNAAPVSAYNNAGAATVPIASSQEVVTTKNGAPPVPPFAGANPTPIATSTTVTTTPGAPVLQSQEPMLASAPVGDTVVEKKEVIVHDRPVTTHRVYVHRKVKYHKSGKVHIARAIKHGAMFMAKLPGRARL